MLQNIKEKTSALKIEKRAFINGKYVNAVDGDIIHKISSIDGRDLSGISSCKEADVNIAVKAIQALRYFAESNESLSLIGFRGHKTF